MRWTHIGIASAVLCLDQLLKAFVHNTLPYFSLSIPYPYGGIGIFHNFFGVDFSINYVTNSGAAWGIFSSYPFVLLCVRIVFVMLLGLWLVFSKTLAGLQRYAFTMICAGALGNIIDFWRWGHVVDMFLFKFGNYIFPLFNIADAAIFCGVALLMIDAYILRKKRNIPTYAGGEG